MANPKTKSKKSLIINDNETANIAVAESPLKIDLHFEFFNRIYHLGGTEEAEKKKKKKRTRKGKTKIVFGSVTTGCIAVVTHEAGLYDRDGYAQVYLPGDLIDNIENIDSDWVVTEFKEIPGTISIHVNEKIACVSKGDADCAYAEFLFYPHLLDPIQLLRFDPGWLKTRDDRKIVAAVEELARKKIEEIFYSDRLQLWRHPDFSQSIGVIFNRLNALMDQMGMVIKPDMTAYRKLPADMSTIIFDFRTLENKLIPQNQTVDPLLISRFGLQPEEITKVSADKDHYGFGAGLFLLAIDGPQRVIGGKERFELISAWCSEQKCSPAADFINCFHKREQDKKARELCRQVFLAMFRYPFYGIGEWADSDDKLYSQSSISTAYEKIKESEVDLLIGEEKNA